METGKVCILFRDTSYLQIKKLLQKVVNTVAKAMHFNNHSKTYSNKVKMAWKIKKDSTDKSQLQQFNYQNQL
jgi:hypothetical protein